MKYSKIRNRVHGLTPVPLKKLHKKDKYTTLYRFKQNLRSMFKKNNMIILMIDANNGDIVDANIAACKFYGYSNEKFKKLNISQINTECEQEAYQKLGQSSELHFQRFYSQHRLSNGEERTVKIYTGPLKIKKKQMVYCIIEDITEKVNIKKELLKKEIQYKELFNNGNDGIFFIEADENVVPKSFIDVNDKACNLLGYKKDELLKTSPLHILAEQGRIRDIIIKNPQKIMMTKKYLYETLLISKNGYYIPIEASIHILELDEKIVYVAMVRDIMKSKKEKDKNLQCAQILDGVLEGISDIVGVYKPDNTIMFYNQAGYDFYHKTPDEVKGKKCYEMLYRKQKCSNCPTEKAIETKQIVRVQRYISEINKYMECCCNPVLNDFGEVILVVEQLRDITGNKKLENILRESEERYRQIVDLLPDAILITVEGKIVLANKEALKYVSHLVGRSLYELAPDYMKIMDKRLSQILEKKRERVIFDYKILLYDKKVVDLEVSSSYLDYMGKPAVISMLRDVTERKKGLLTAAKIQKRALQNVFPFPDKADMETLYMPARTVSGDFFHIHKADENLVIGIIADVSGKGITAALNISAFNVLFREAVLDSHDPFEIVNNLNIKIGNYLDESYIAACCFSFDFKNNEGKVVGAGINQLIYQKSKGEWEKIIVKGPFLGMFENSVFDEQTLHFYPRDKFYFFTDGLEFVFDNDETIENYLKTATITGFRNYLKNYLKEMLSDIDGIKDDCTLLALEIK